VKGLATRGRKRGFCAVAATQRLSKLHEGRAAECNNKLIGRTGSTST
jgi:DNA helicase HerA-like ATPase